jgi:hypothetical protein
MQALIKESAPANIARRRFDRFVYVPEHMVWRREHDHRPLYEIVYMSLYSWQQDPAREQQTPVIHYVIFDFDSQMQDLAQTDAVNFVRYLNAVHEVDIACLGLYFSGSKGFHVQLPIGLVVEEGEGGLWGVSPGIIRSFAMRLATGFATCDPSVYDARRLFRAPNAINTSSGLYKVPLTWRELTGLDMSEIRTIATSPRPFVDLAPPPVSPSLYELMLATSETHNPTTRESTVTLHELFEHAESGERNTRATQLSGLLVKATGDLPLVREIVRLWNRNNRSPLSERELDTIITGVYQRYHNNHATNRRKHHAIGF